MQLDIVTNEIGLVLEELMNFIQTTDPKAFITVYKVAQVNYQPKTIEQ